MVFLCQIPVSGFINQDVTYKSAGVAKKNHDEFAEKLHDLVLQLRGREQRAGSSHCYSWKASLLSAQHGKHTPSPAAAARLAF